MDYIERNHTALLECMFLLRKRFENFCIPTKPNSFFDLVAFSSWGSRHLSSIKIVCTESKKESGSYVANLLTSGGYRDQKEVKKHFEPSNCHFVFVWTPEDKYLIPTNEITQTKSITLSVFEEYKLTMPS